MRLDVSWEIDRTMRGFSLRPYQPSARRVYQPAAVTPPFHEEKQS